jgi:hypothetical protein
MFTFPSQLHDKHIVAGIHERDKQICNNNKNNFYWGTFEAAIPLLKMNPDQNLQYNDYINKNIITDNI